MKPSLCICLFIHFKYQDPFCLKLSSLLSYISWYCQIILFNFTFLCRATIRKCHYAHIWIRTRKRVTILCRSWQTTAIRSNLPLLKTRVSFNIGFWRAKLIPLCVVYGYFLTTIAEYFWHRPSGQLMWRDLLYDPLQ